MYSRNFAAFENVSSVKLNNELRSREVARENTVPVKNFSDSSAYERFSSLGISKIDDTSSEENNIEVTENVASASEENNEIHEEKVISEVITEKILEEKAEDENSVSVQKSDTKNEKLLFPIFGNIHKISDIFDSDLLLIALAAALIFFGNNETNDKLTPIALLAIIFL